MPRKFIDVYDLQDHTNEMVKEVVPEIVKEVGGTGGSGTATNIADWAEKDNMDTIPVEKTNIADWAIKNSTTSIPTSAKCEVPTAAQDMFGETSTIGDLFESISSSSATFEEALENCATKDELGDYVTTEEFTKYDTSLNSKYSPVVSKISGVKEGVVLTATSDLNLDTLNTNVTDLATKVDSVDVEGITSDISDIKTRVTTLESSSGSDEDVLIYQYGDIKTYGETLSTPNTSLNHNSEEGTYLDTNALSLIMGGKLYM